MRKLTILFLLCFINLGVASQPLMVRVKANYALLMNAKTGKILFQKNMDQKVYPASTTKIATILYIFHTFKNLDLDQEVVVNQKDILRVTESFKVSRNFEVPAFLLEFDGVHFGLRPGEKVTLRTLLHALMLHSSNDPANVLASYFCKDIDYFMRKINLFLKEIGCTNTQLLNPHGLYHPNHYTTPHDLAIITQKAMEYPEIRDIVKKVEFECPPTNKNKEKVIKQKNFLLQEGPFYYSKAIGVKTGYTRIAGNNLVAMAKDGDRELIAVVNKLESKQQMYRDVIKMFDIAFSEIKTSRILFNKSESYVFVSVKNAKNKCRAILNDSISIDYFPSEQPKLDIQQNWLPLKAPIKKGEIVGHLIVKDEFGHVLVKCDYLSDNEIDQTLVAKIGFYANKIFTSYLFWLPLILGLFFIGYRYGNFTSKLRFKSSSH